MAVLEGVWKYEKLCDSLIIVCESVSSCVIRYVWQLEKVWVCLSMHVRSYVSLCVVECEGE